MDMKKWMIDIKIYGKMDGWLDGQKTKYEKDGWLDGWMDRKNRKMVGWI